jgi:hypothetical protein
VRIPWRVGQDQHNVGACLLNRNRRVDGLARRKLKNGFNADARGKLASAPAVVVEQFAGAIHE